MTPKSRLDRLRARLEGSDVQAAVITDPVNIAYLSGFDGVFDGEDAHAAVISNGLATIFTDTRYADAMTAAAAGTPWQVRVVRDSLYITMCDEISAQGIEAIALESSVPYGRFRYISREFNGNVESSEDLVEELRQVKDDEEIRRIAAAQELTDSAFDHILPRVEVGATEFEIALEIEFFMRKNGSEGVAFPPIVASGPNSARPHAKVSTRTFEPGDFVKMDFGARLDGYCADMTRTVVIGNASDRQQEIYAAVLAANEAGIAAVRAGQPGQAIDAAAREVIVAAGFGDLFGHGLGHGVGMEVHEGPSLNPRSAKSVRRGAVVTVEPGVYVPGFGGVRIEDLVVVEENGARNLTRSPKDLMEL